jgi:ribosomal protein L12E/L44/L45/RPP1/RPP2
VLIGATSHGGGDDAGAVGAEQEEEEEGDEDEEEEMNEDGEVGLPADVVFAHTFAEAVGGPGEGPGEEAVKEKDDEDDEEEDDESDEEVAEESTSWVTDEDLLKAFLVAEDMLEEDEPQFHVGFVAKKAFRKPLFPRLYADFCCSLMLSVIS